MEAPPQLLTNLKERNLMRRGTSRCCLLLIVLLVSILYHLGRSAAKGRTLSEIPAAFPNSPKQYLLLD